MKRFSFSAPRFLKRIDLYLLQHYPIIWETRILQVLFYSAFVANVALIFLGFLVPLSNSYVPSYLYLVNMSMFWGGILAVLALGYYAYSQSFVRVRTYSIKQNFLRLALYSMAVASIGVNLFTLPNTVILRVQMLYPRQTVEQDYLAIIKAQTMRDCHEFLQKSHYEGEVTPVLQGVEKSYLNEHNELTMLQEAKKKWRYATEKLVENHSKKLAIYDSVLSHVAEEKRSFPFLDEDVKRVRAFVKAQPWHPILQDKLCENIAPDNILHLRDSDIDKLPLELVLPQIQAIYNRYPAEKPAIFIQYIYQPQQTNMPTLYDNIQNIRHYQSANLFLQIPYRHQMFNILDKAWGLNNEYKGRESKDIFEELKAKIRQTYANETDKIKQEWRRKEAKENDVIKRLHLQEDYTTQMNKIRGLEMQELTKYLTDKKAFERVALPIAQDFKPYPLLAFFGVFVSWLFVSLFVWVGKTLSLRSLFVGSLGVLLSLGLGAILVLATLHYFPSLKYFIALNDYAILRNTEFERYLSDLKYGIGALGLLIAGVAYYVLAYRVHTRWLELFWVYAIMFAFVGAGFMTFLAFDGAKGSLSGTEGKHGSLGSEVVYSANSADFEMYMFLSFVLVFFVWSAYTVYNRMMNFPVRK